MCVCNTVSSSVFLFLPMCYMSTQHLFWTYSHWPFSHIIWSAIVHDYSSVNIQNMFCYVAFRAGSLFVYETDFPLLLFFHIFPTPLLNSPLQFSLAFLVVWRSLWICWPPRFHGYSQDFLFRSPDLSESHLLTRMSRVSVALWQHAAFALLLLHHAHSQLRFHSLGERNF